MKQISAEQQCKWMLAENYKYTIRGFKRHLPSVFAVAVSVAVTGVLFFCAVAEFIVWK